MFDVIIAVYPERKSRSKSQTAARQIPESLASAGGWNRNNQNCVMIVYNSDCRIHG
jgi:hypothetical protein